MSMGAVDGEDIHFCLRQFLGAFQKISRGADRRAHTQTALKILRRIWILQLLLDVFDCDQALQVVVVVNHQELFHAVLVQDFFGLFERGSDRDRDQVLLGHHAVDGNVEAGLEAQVAVGKNADKLALLGDGHPRDFVFAHHFEGVRDLVGRIHGDRVDNHAAFRALHLVNLVGLLFD